MKKLLLLATAAVLAMSASAVAGTINLQLQEDANAPVQFLGAPGQSTFSNTGQQFGDFLISNITGSTSPSTVNPVLLSSNTLDIQNTSSGAHTLDVWITGNGLTSPLGVVDVFSLFTNVILSDGWTVRLDSLVSTTDAMFTGTLIDTALFVGTAIPQAFSSTEFSTENFGTGPFSLTAHYHITTDGDGQANSGITIGATAATPLPAAVWMFGSAIGGGAFLLRRRKKKQSEPLAA